MSSQISTCRTKSATSDAANNKSGPNGTSGDPDGAALVVAGRDLAALIELAVGRQIRLGRHTQYRAAVDEDGGVVNTMPIAQRGTDNQHRQQVSRSGDDVGQGILDGVQQHVLQQDVLDGIPGQRQLRENGHRDAVVVAQLSKPEHRGRVGRRVADRGVVRARGDPGKPLAVGVVEVHRLSIVARPAQIGTHRVSPDARACRRTAESVPSKR
jgi:hypothetical protein